MHEFDAPCLLKVKHMGKRFKQENVVIRTELRPGDLLMHREKGIAQLRYFIVDPAFRGTGLGKKLAALFLNFLREKGYKRAYLWTTDELFTAAHIYRKMGFRLTEEKLSTTFGKQVKEQRYDLILTAAG